MATATLKLNTKRAKNNNTYPIILVVGHKTKASFISTIFSIPEKYWDNGRIKRGCPHIENINMANNKLSNILTEAEDCIKEDSKT